MTEVVVLGPSRRGMCSCGIQGLVLLGGPWDLVTTEN